MAEKEKSETGRKKMVKKVIFFKTTQTAIKENKDKQIVAF